MSNALPSIEAYAEAARQRLHDAVWRHLQQGDGGDIAAYAAARFWPRPLRDLRHGGTSLQLLGQTLSHPLLLAPVAFQRLFHAEGESASAIAATAQGSLPVISSLASQPFAAIRSAAAQGGTTQPWFQLYWQGDRERTQRLLDRALAAGVKAVVFTIDTPFKESGLQLPPGVTAVNMEPTPPLPSDSIFQGWMARAARWEDLEWLRSVVKLPLLVKGVMHPDDAQRAVDAGCDGLIVSGHGGRVSDRVPASLDALRGISTRIGDRVPLIADGGIRHGRDAFVALASGATAVLVGRPYIWGLATHGAMGVAQVIRILRLQFEMTMALAGCATLADINRSCLAPSLGQG